MNKKEAIELFREVYDTGIPDRVMLSEEWGIFTDGLCKDGLISDNQYNNWVNPFN